MSYQYGCTVNAEARKEILKEILSSAALVLVVGLAILPARASAASPPKSDLNVQIVIQTSPGGATPIVYAPVNVPQGTVVSVSPSPPSIINCPTDCSEIGLASNTDIKLVAPSNLVPNAHFYQWKDIPGSSGLSISNFCTYSSFNPNMNCTMAGSRFIQAVYICNDTYSYDSVSRQCKKSAGTGQTACYILMPGRTACSLGLQINRAKKGPKNTYTVTVSPSAITPSVNTAPSSASSCVNTGSSALQTGCSFYYNSYPTSVTLTATSSPGSLPSGFSWFGACKSSGSNAMCIVTQGPPVNVVANFP